MKFYLLSNIEMLIVKIYNFDYFDFIIVLNFLCKFIFCSFLINYLDNVIIDN